MRGEPGNRRVTRLSARRAALLAAAIPTVTLAQPPSAAATDELNQALLRYAFRHDGGNARLVPGRVPDDLAPNFYAPPGTRVLGTIVSGSTAVVLAATNAPADSLRAEYTRALEPRGWTPWEAPARGGFVATMAEFPLAFCREGANLHVTHRRRATPPHDLQLEYRESGGRCQDRTSAERMALMRMEERRFPTLRSPEPPPGRPIQSCYPRNTTGYGYSTALATTVSTDLRPNELLQYYARQLEAAGWSLPGGGASPTTVTGTWTRSDSSGVSQVLTLELTEGARGCYQASMKIAR